MIERRCWLCIMAGTARRTRITSSSGFATPRNDAPMSSKNLRGIPQVNWSAQQALFLHKCDSPVIFMLGCCYAGASVHREQSSSTVVALVVTGFHSVAPMRGSDSFTTFLTKALKQMRENQEAVDISYLKTMISDILNSSNALGERGTDRRVTPDYFPFFNDPKRAITLRVLPVPGDHGSPKVVPIAAVERKAEPSPQSVPQTPVRNGARNPPPAPTPKSTPPRTPRSSIGLRKSARATQSLSPSDRAFERRKLLQLQQGRQSQNFAGGSSNSSTGSEAAPTTRRYHCRVGDQLCINWVDEKEPQDQGELIPGIFQRASKLGEASDDSYTAIDFIPDLLDLTLIDLLVKEESIPVKWQALINLMKPPYFSRRWVFLELMLAKHAVLYCGGALIDWGEFTDAVIILGSRYDDVRLLVRAAVPSDQSSKLDSLVDPRSLAAYSIVEASREYFRRQGDGSSLATCNLEELVSRLPALQSWHPIAVIYALLPLATDRQLWTYEASDSPLESLDIICRPWAPKTKAGSRFHSEYGTWPRAEKLPSWICQVNHLPFGEDSKTGRKSGDLFIGHANWPFYAAAGGSIATPIFGKLSKSGKRELNRSMTVNGFVNESRCSRGRRTNLATALYPITYGARSWRIVVQMAHWHRCGITKLVCTGSKNSMATTSREPNSRPAALIHGAAVYPARAKRHLEPYSLHYYRRQGSNTHELVLFWGGHFSINEFQEHQMIYSVMRALRKERLDQIHLRRRSPRLRATTSTKASRQARYPLRSQEHLEQALDAFRSQQLAINPKEAETETHEGSLASDIETDSIVAAPKPFPFFALPAELRNQIYTHLAATENTVTVAMCRSRISADWHAGYKPLLPKPPALLQVCEQARTEYFPIWVSQTEFTLGLASDDSIEVVRMWLEWIRPFAGCLNQMSFILRGEAWTDRRSDLPKQAGVEIMYER
ncbi:uncharacterized protein BDZ99DRAFT_499453 [Mytilinidion resinicola]|uniref:2EXR domain-containing protein n=1 Tax=Mytilinidion resinicola TaxID=574789 RepID=A0A6A6YK58_9PEZI|nr:uncharacterized protein BDZ99DRAFT_499453 [Mytilinidion resinicola]KAF2809170.1 hypothetical protein BDZ99DRAFT_499453 [Mytilinidion resinicola]